MVDERLIEQLRDAGFEVELAMDLIEHQIQVWHAQKEGVSTYVPNNEVAEGLLAWEPDPEPDQTPES